jgi:hypothetical protein
MVLGKVIARMKPPSLIQKRPKVREGRKSRSHPLVSSDSKRLIGEVVYEVPTMPGIDGCGKILRPGNPPLGIQVSFLR